MVYPMQGWTHVNVWKKFRENKLYRTMAKQRSNKDNKESTV